MENCINTTSYFYAISFNQKFVLVIKKNRPCLEGTKWLKLPTQNIRRISCIILKIKDNLEFFNNYGLDILDYDFYLSFLTHSKTNRKFLNSYFKHTTKQIKTIFVL